MSLNIPSKWQSSLIQLLSIAGILLSFYLWLYHRGDLVVVCRAGGWEDCGKVSGPGAPYAEIGGVSVALLGLWGYVAIFLTIWAKEWSDWIAGNLPDLLIALTGVALLFTLALTGLELFVIHAFCRYCLVSAAIVLVMFVLAWQLLRQRNEA
jgi:uncharacterized membrane protein